MLKVLFYIDVFKNQGGAQRVLANLIEYLIKRDYEIVLVSDYNDNSPYYDDEIGKKIKIRYLTNNNNGNTLVKNIRKVFSLRKIIRTEKPGVCVSFLGMPNIRLLIAKTGLSIPCLVSIRSDPNVEYGKNRIIKFFINFLFKKASGIIIQTEYVKEYFCKAIQPILKVIYNPVNDDLYQLERNREQKNIVTFGSLLECKNQKMLIDSFVRVIDFFPEDDLYIYGEGKYRGFLEDYVSKLHLGSRVHFPGLVPNVGEILCKSKMFVLTSNYEGMPNALMEAMATGTPCISTDCPSGGPRTLITNESEGILIKCNDVIELSNKMVYLNSEEVRKIMIENSKKRALIFKGELILLEWERYLCSFIRKE